MKKTLGLIAAVMMVCIMLIGCSGEKTSEAVPEAASVEGTTWQVYKIVDGDTEKTGDDIAMYGEIIYTFKADNVLDVESNGATETGTYSQDGVTIEIDVNGERDLELTDNEMILTYGGMDFVFEKTN